MSHDLGIKQSEAQKHKLAVRFDREFFRIGFRSIARDTDERTLIFAMLPKNCGYGHSMFANCSKRYFVNDMDGGVATRPTSPLRILFALAWFNSIATDWIARQMIQINVSQTYLYRLPTPQPTDTEILSNPGYAQLAKNALLLTLAASWEDFHELAPLFSVKRADVPSTKKAMDVLRAENDKIVARLYGITDAEFKHLLKSFPGMANKRPEYMALLQ